MATQRGETQLVCFGGAKAAESTKRGGETERTDTRAHRGTHSDRRNVGLSVCALYVQLGMGKAGQAAAAAVFLLTSLSN